MKKLSQYLSVGVLAVVLASISGCVHDHSYYASGRSVGRSPYIGSPEWITWVDHKVDTRYSNGNRPDPGTQEWYAIVDHVVFADYSKDYYRNVYRNEYRKEYRRYHQTSSGYSSRRTTDNYVGPARFGSRGGTYYGDEYGSGNYRLGSIEWKKAVDARILSGRVPPPPPRSDPWDAPLAPTH